MKTSSAVMAMRSRKHYRRFEDFCQYSHVKSVQIRSFFSSFFFVVFFLICTIWYHLYNLKKAKNTNELVLVYRK